jgi:curved DNA binding protein
MRKRFDEGSPLEDPNDSEEEWVTENEEESIMNSDVLTKYKEAAKFTNGAMKMAIEMVESPGASVRAICTAVDEFLNAKCANVYTKSVDENGRPIAKGIAFPTTVSVNQVVCHYTGMNEDLVLAAGDVVKVHLGCQIDGYPATAGHTVVVAGGSDDFVARNVVNGAHVACAAVTRMLHPSEENADLSEVIENVSKYFGVEPVEGVLSHRVKRFIIDGQKCVINRRILDVEPRQDVEPMTIEVNQVYNIDIVLSSGIWQLRPSDAHPTTLYRRNEVQAPLRMKSARHTLMEVRKRFHSFPFVVQDVFQGELARSKFGVKSLAEAGLIDPLSVMESKGNAIVARFSCTVAVTERTVDVLCGLLPSPPVDAAFPPALRSILTRPLTHGPAT